MTAPATHGWRRAAAWAGAALLAWAAACAPARAQQPPLRVFGQLDGLANLSVQAIVEDRAGYLWIGTENGLFRFDGARARRHPLGKDGGDTNISALHLDPAGRLWVGTGHGLFLLRERRLLPVRRPDGKPMPVRPGQHLASIDANNLLVQSNGRLYQVRADGRGRWYAAAPFTAQLEGEIERWQATEPITAARLAARPPLNDLYGMLRDPDGTLWLGCKRSLCRYRDGVLTMLGEAQGLPPRHWDNLMRDRDGALWLSAADRVMALAPGGTRFRDHTPAGFANTNGGPSMAMLQDGGGRLVSLSDNGLFIGGAKGWRRYGAREGVHVATGAHALLLDRGGDLWLGLPGRGMAQWQGYRHWENWTAAQGLPDDNVWAILRTGGGELYVGTGRGLAEARGARLATVAIAGAARQAWGALAEDAHGNLWGGSLSGVLMRRERGGSRAAVVARLPNLMTIYHLLFDPAGRLWISAADGLYVIADPRRAAVPVRVEQMRTLLGPDPSFAGGCSDAGGRLWFAGPNGLARLEEGRWSRPPLPRDDHVFSHVVCDGNTLWLVEGDSARVWRADTAQPGFALRPFASPQLEGRALLSALVDRRHWLWLGTDSGAMLWNGRRWRLFNEQSGLVWNDTNQSALYEDKDGSVWIGTSNGVSRVRRPESLFAPQPVPLYLDTARYAGAALGGATAPWNGGSLEVRMAAPLLQNREALSYRYRLLGQEEAWSRSDNGELRYAALAPGGYRLQVVAEHAMSQSSSATLELPLTITPPWWRTRWAYAGAALLALGAIGLLHRYRVRRVLRQRALLERRVAERTAELEASREEHRLRSLKDGLTKAWNRTALMERLAALTAPGAGPFLLVLLDLDHFKKVNDTHGHLAGDEVLREMVRRIQAQLRASDTVGRYGGEEFMLLLPGLDLAGGGRRLAQLHREVCAAPVEIDGFGPLPVTCSGGVVVGRAELSRTAEQWIALADQALYRAKALGRNRLEYAPEAGLA